MKVRTVITTEIDLPAIYELCRPIDKQKCVSEIRKFVDFQIEMMTDPDGGWRYPCDVMIANHLVENALAVSMK